MLLMYHRKRFNLQEELKKTDKARKKSIVIMAISIAIVFAFVLIMTPKSTRLEGMKFVFSSILFIGGVIIVSAFLIKWFLTKRK